MNRLSHLHDTTFDLIIIGGGIVGSGIARDAALRGLSVALFDKSDYCSGTTARSTRLIHGGLRYLETLDFRLVRLDLVEREILLRIAKHLVRPLPFVVPFYNCSRAYRCKVKLGLTVYDLLGFDKTLPSHTWLNSQQIVTSEPLLQLQGLQGGFRYYDAQVPAPERLVIENLIDAREHGAHAYNYAEVIGALYDGDTVHRVRVRDLPAMNEIEVKGRVVVNAGGPWADQICKRIALHPKNRIRMTKGIHIVCPPFSKEALVFFSRLDGRLFFVVPWLGRSLVGTTDTDFFEDPDEVKAQPGDIKYLLNSIQPFIPSINGNQVLYSYAGVRALAPDEGAPSSISRMHLIVDEAKNGIHGLISIIGGKITGYRAIAEQAVDMACAKLGVRRDCKTAATPLPGCRGSAPDAPDFLDEKTVQHLFALYGSRATEVIDLAQSNIRLRKPLAPGYPDIAAQVVHSIRNEQCIRATDFLLRRTLMGYSPDQGCSALPAVAAQMAVELSWSEAKMEEEIAAHMEWVQQTKPKDATNFTD
jgi:glycerol-3-phosphate dehydrogenase